MRQTVKTETYSDAPEGETGNKIDVLDHGFVRLVDYMGDDLSIVRAARVSYAAAWRAGVDEGSDAKLIQYLWKNRHTSPFEAVTLTWEVKAPIFVFRQWHRHRTWSYSELSGRYKELPNEFYIPGASIIGAQSKDNKQGRDIGEIPNPFDEPPSRSADIDVYESMCKMAFRTYEDLLREGWPRELARAVLPVSTYSHMFATVNLRNLFHFLDLRLHEHAQWEIQQYAKAMKELSLEVAPVAVAAWRDCQ